MKLTKARLNQIIKEEISKLNEQFKLYDDPDSEPFATYPSLDALEQALASLPPDAEDWIVVGPGIEGKAVYELF